jgi:hypothetical protein
MNTYKISFVGFFNGGIDEKFIHEIRFAKRDDAPLAMDILGTSLDLEHSAKCPFPYLVEHALFSYLFNLAYLVLYN